MTSEADQFDKCSLDEIMFVTFDTFGSEGLREMLERAIQGKLVYREGLEGVADKLEATGLSEAASIIRETAEKAPSEIPAKIARILTDPHQANRRAYLGQMYRSGQATLDQMTARGVDPDTLAFVARSIEVSKRTFH
jgi:hypothetical protein